jgi:hypothetical protein
MTTSAAEVITQYSQLLGRWQSPSDDLAWYVSAFAKDVIAKRGPFAEKSMFYPPGSTRYPETWVKLVGSDLRHARVFQVTGEMCSAVTQLYGKVIDEKTGSTTRLSIDELPSDAGFIWLDEPPSLKDRRGKITRSRAVSWHTLPIADDEIGNTTGIRIIIWADSHVSDDYDIMFLPGVRQRSERDLGRLQLQHSFVMPLDRDIQDDAAILNRIADDFLEWFRVLFMLLGTEIASTSRATLPKSVKANLNVKRPEVTVVTLRRVHHASPSPGKPATTVDWSHRWIVRGHHRHLDSYATEKHRATPVPGDRKHCECGARITWVWPYVKGPDGAPLVTDRTVYRLSR